jgi:hypothetical protein
VFISKKLNNNGRMTEMKKSTLSNLSNSSRNGIFAVDKFMTGNCICSFSKTDSIIEKVGDNNIDCSKLGQLINDYSSMTHTDDLFGEINRYISTAAKCNVFISNNDVYALKPINPGDELFLHYGVGYFIKSLDSMPFPEFDNTKYDYLKGVHTPELLDDFIKARNLVEHTIVIRTRSRLLCGKPQHYWYSDTSI